MMNRRSYLGLAMGVGLIAAVLSMTSAGSVLAQGPLRPLEALIVNATTQPVPVRSVDVRTPFSYSDIGECNSANCFFEFPAVPAGKRLVILHVNGIARPSSSATVFDQAELVSDNTELTDIGVTNTFAMTLIGRAGSSVISNTWGFNSPILAFVKPGHIARLSMATSVGGTTFFASATISGYLENVQ